MELVGPDTGGALWVGCVRQAASLPHALLPWRWPALFLDLVIRAFRLLRQPWLGRYSHLFLWRGTTIWEASTIWRRGDIREYDRRDLIVDAMEVVAALPRAPHRLESLCHQGAGGTPGCRRGGTPRLQSGGTGLCRGEAVPRPRATHRVAPTSGASRPAVRARCIVPLQPWQVRKAIEMAEAMVGRPYDWYQLIRIAAFELGILHDDRMLPRDGARPICSEGVAMCFLAAGIDLPGAAGVPLWRFAPDHMDKLRRTRPDLVRLVGRLRWDGDPRRTPKARRGDTTAGSRLRALRVPSRMVGNASAREERP